jgi:hypothetical protein
MSSIIIADRDFPLRLIAGLNERAREDTHSITAVWPCSMSTGNTAHRRRSRGSRVVRSRSSDPNEPAGFSGGIPHLSRETLPCAR